MELGHGGSFLFWFAVGVKFAEDKGLYCFSSLDFTDILVLSPNNLVLFADKTILQYKTIQNIGIFIGYYHKFSLLYLQVLLIFIRLVYFQNLVDII